MILHLASGNVDFRTPPSKYGAYMFRFLVRSVHRQLLEKALHLQRPVNPAAPSPTAVSTKGAQPARNTSEQTHFTMAEDSRLERFELGNFELNSGEALPNAFLAYKTFGDRSKPVIINPTWYTGCS